MAQLPRPLQEARTARGREDITPVICSHDTCRRGGGEEEGRGKRGEGRRGEEEEDGSYFRAPALALVVSCSACCSAAVS